MKYIKILKAFTTPLYHFSHTSLNAVILSFAFTKMIIFTYGFTPDNSILMLFDAFEISHTVKPQLFKVPGNTGILSNNR